MAGWKSAALLLLPPLFAAIPSNAAKTWSSRLPSVPLVKPVPVLHSGPVMDRNGTVIPPYDTTYYFDQLIDHNNPSLGTFKQRYWHTWEFYEPGGPIILTTPGEEDADGFEGFLTNATINGMIAQQNNGATIVIEHRYYGFSNPYDNLSVAALQYHTIQQAIDDLAYFAYNVKLPMPGGDHVTPAEAPWVLIGGSYAGALTSFTKVNKPDVFWAAWASSGVVESIVNYWGYFDIIRTHMASNCSADLQALVTYFDDAVQSNNQTAINAVVTAFNLTALTHLDDVANALSDPLGAWQDLQPNSELISSIWFQFCDALEVKNGVNAPAEGWGLEHTIQAYSSWWNDFYYQYTCGDDDVAYCLGTYDATASYYTNITINNAERSWFWIVCNEMGFFQGGAPEGTPTIVSRLVDPAYYEHQCMLYYPEAFSSPQVPLANVTNAAYDGWFVKSDRLFFANGQRDPWRDVTVSADGTNFSSTTQQPIAVGDGFHCSDMYAGNAAVDASIALVQQQGLAAMAEWLAEWTPPSRS